MTNVKPNPASQHQAQNLSDASRKTGPKQAGFMQEMFLGNLRLDLIHPYPRIDLDRQEFRAFYEALKDFLREEVDSVEIDTTGEYPERVLDGLRKLGAFGLKIPQKYGGLGFTHLEYHKVMELLGSTDGNLSALLSGHQSIGVPQPIKLFGTEEQKREFLPRCARGEISAFALTEPEVGSDPAQLTTTARRTSDGKAYILNGIKLWCTNGTIAKLLVVMARDPETDKISAFVVETDWEGVKVEGRCHFMGLRALANAVISFTDVRVPVENLIGQEGKGLKIALTTLNDGRLSIPNGSVGTVKTCLEICRRWANERVQWGKPIGRHEAITHKLADMAATTFAMESLVKLATALFDRGDSDIRLEAAAAKEWNTDRTWRIVDDTMQIRGGRGYETESSLAARGEEPIGVERMMRDYRINQIYEGSSEIMHLLMAREAVKRHLHLVGSLFDPGKSGQDRLAALFKCILHYAIWYPSRWLGWSGWPRYRAFGSLAHHLRFVDRRSRKLAREVFHAILVFRARMPNKQAFLFRLVDIANELFAMAASVSRAATMKQEGRPEGVAAVDLADQFCRTSRGRVDRLFHELWHNDDVQRYRAGLQVLEGRHEWLEEGSLGLEAALASLEIALAPETTDSRPRRPLTTS